jgi:hypothetical protein
MVQSGPRPLNGLQTQSNFLIGNQRISDLGFLKKIGSKESLISVFLKASKNQQFLQNNQQRTGSFMEGYLTGS